jgi:hypothetical protein
VIGHLGQAEPTNFLALVVAHYVDICWIARARKVDQIDVLMPGLNVFELNAGWPNQLARMGDRKTALADQLDRHTGFFSYLADRCLVRQFVDFDVSARGQPLLQLAMPEQ